MRIALDAMGTNRAPEIEVLGALQAASDLAPDAQIVLVGDRRTIEDELSRHSGPKSGIAVHHAPDRVRPDDQPSTVMRRRPRSSIVVGLRLHSARKVDAFVSAGSTGAVMAASLFSLKRIRGVSRPAIATMLPTLEDECLLLDAGANLDCKPRHLVQFAHLGTAYVRRVLGRDRPRVGLLNVGEEPGKGGETLTEAYELLSEDPTLNFVGNVEGRDLVASVCDVVACDGFVGNVLLKFYESVASLIVRLLKEGLSQRASDAELRRIFRVLDYQEVGGAPLLGVRGVPIICHGVSSPRAIRNALLAAARAVTSGVVAHSAREFQALAKGGRRATVS